MRLNHAPHLRDCLEDFQRSLADAGTTFRGVSTEIVLCSDCGGRGTMTLRDFAFTAEDFAEDPDFAEDYRSGFYDEPCSTCDGAGRYVDLSTDQPHPEVHDLYDQWLMEAAEDAALRRAESGYMY